MRRMVALMVATAWLLAPGESQAQISYLNGSGVGTTPGAGVRDSNWNIVAGPGTGWSPPDGQSYPYAAYVPGTIWQDFVGASGIAPDPGQWYYQTQNGYTDPGTGQTSYWISPANTNNTASLFPWNDGWTSYNWIAAQKFTISEDGIYTFNFPIAGDNEISFYIDGNVDNTDPMFPVIVGGTQVGGTYDNFAVIGNISGNVYLTAGEHTAYMKLYDYGGETGALIGTSSFVQAVPEPGTMILTGLALTGMGGAAWRRRRKQQADDTAAPATTV